MSIDFDSNESTEFLDNVWQDPIVNQMRSEIQDYNTLLRTEDTTPEELESITAELAEGWGGLLESGIRVTGYMTFPKIGAQRREDGTFETERVLYEDYEVQVKGFFGEPIPITLDDEQVACTHKLKLAVDRTTHNTETEQDETHTGVLDLDEADVTISNMSLERAKAWLEYHHSDDLEELESRILNADSGEGTATLSLNGFSVMLNKDDVENRSRQAFNIYLEHLLNYDSEVPYHAAVNGRCFVISEEEGDWREASVDESRWLVMIDEIVMATTGGDDQHIPLLSVNLLFADKDAPSQAILFPIDSIQNLVSIRDIFYE